MTVGNEQDQRICDRTQCNAILLYLQVITVGDLAELLETTSVAVIKVRFD
jgi:hypothetical protein